MSGDLPTLENMEHRLKGMENWYEELMRSNQSHKESTDKHLKTLSESLVKVVDQIEKMNQSHNQLTENMQNMNLGHEAIIRRLGLLEDAGGESVGAANRRCQRNDGDEYKQSIADDEEDGEEGSVGNRRRRPIRNRDDTLSKVKFTMASFDGKFEPSVYLDWELAVEQKFSCYEFPDNKKVKAASSEFTSFASLWWNDICTRGLRPRTWNDMKRAMRSRFVPSYYARDMLNKLQLLQQGTNSVETYYQEMMIALSRCDLQETEDASIARFNGGLNREIQDILDYKDYNNMNRLFHVACKAEREVQGRNWCHGIGHIARNCPNQRVLFVNDDGGQDNDDIEEVHLHPESLDQYPSLIVKLVLSAKEKCEEQNQRHNLFQSKVLVKGHTVKVINDSGSCNNLASAEMIKKLGLTTHLHPHPYHIQRFNTCGKMKVTRFVKVPFSCRIEQD
uniref:Retrotransposon gag domain-containing protein n=1 Tax=Oryza brachyantha TaxID=4533 RepID=J3MF95_ORYBR